MLQLFKTWTCSKTQHASRVVLACQVVATYDWRDVCKNIVPWKWPRLVWGLKESKRIEVNPLSSILRNKDILSNILKQETGWHDFVAVSFLFTLQLHEISGTNWKMELQFFLKWYQWHSLWVEDLLSCQRRPRWVEDKVKGGSEINIRCLRVFWQYFYIAGSSTAMYAQKEVWFALLLPLYSDCWKIKRKKLTGCQRWDASPHRKQVHDFNLFIKLFNSDLLRNNYFST